MMIKEELKKRAESADKKREGKGTTEDLGEL